MLHKMKYLNTVLFFFFFLFFSFSLSYLLEIEKAPLYKRPGPSSSVVNSLTGFGSQQIFLAATRCHLPEH